MTVYHAAAGALPVPPPRRPDVTALMVPLTPAVRARVPLARPAGPHLDLTLLDLGRWSWLDLVLLPLALWLAEETGQRRRPYRAARRGRHRHVPGDRPRPAAGPSTRCTWRTRTAAAGWTHHTTTTTPGETR